MVAGLALTPVPPSGFGIIGHALGLGNKTYRRVGRFRMDYFQEDCFQHEEPQVVDLV